MFSRDEMQRAIEDALRSMEGVALELYRRGREESREELETVKRERDEARAKCDSLSKQVDTLNRNCTTHYEHGLQLRRWLDETIDQRDEARAEVERQREMAHDFEAMREDRDAAIARITEVGVMVATNGNALTKEAYRRGAEAMREACIGYAHKIGFHGLTVDIRALPIPEEP